MPRLLAEMEKWSTEGPYLQRAAAAGLCEPSLLKEPEHVVRVLKILDRMTKSLAATSARKTEGFRVLRQAMAYSWSVAAAALPESGRPLMERWLRSPDKDVAWVMQENLTKGRIMALGPSWVAKWRRKVSVKAPASVASPAKTSVRETSRGKTPAPPKRTAPVKRAARAEAKGGAKRSPARTRATAKPTAKWYSPVTDCRFRANRESATTLTRV